MQPILHLILGATKGSVHPHNAVLVGNYVKISESVKMKGVVKK